MSNFLGIATVTEAFRQVLNEATITSGVAGASATAVRPTSGANNGQPGSPPKDGVNLFLYQVTPNGAFRNADTPNRRSDGSLIQPTRSAYDLHYLLTFYGSEMDLVPQRVLGSVLGVLHSLPLLTHKRVESAKMSLLLPFLAASNLEIELETIKLNIIPLNLEELSKLWSVFFQTTYNLSVAFQASVLFIDGTDISAPALPVYRRNFYMRPIDQPVIDQVLSQKTLADPAESNSPIVAGDILVLAGRQLRGDIVSARIAGIEVVPDEVSDTQVRVSLKSPPFPVDSLRAGVQGAQLIYRLNMGTPETQHQGFESNAAAFVLRPQVTPGAVLITKSFTVDLVKYKNATLTLNLDPKVGSGQRLVLLLNEYNPPPNRAARAYRFEIKMPALPPDPVGQLDALVTSVAEGSYLVRVQVDGAESLLDPGPNPEAPKYVGPLVNI